MLPYNTSLKNISRRLRENMTDAERVLWARVRRKQLKGCQFYRQRIIGDYVVDFYCPAARLVVEVDGSQHYTPDAAERDGRRDAFIERNRLKVIRFSDREVLGDLECVVRSIYDHMTVE